MFTDQLISIGVGWFSVDEKISRGWRIADRPIALEIVGVARGAGVLRL